MKSKSALFLLACMAVGSIVHAQPLPDPFKFPALTERKVFKRWWHLAQRRANPPPNALIQAQERTKQAPLVAATWTSLGPQPIHFEATTWTGRVATIAVDPSQPDHWLLGAAQGGIWQSTDSGATWVPRTDDQPSLASGALAFAPSDPQIVYAGTGEAVFSGDAYGGVGLLKSTDGGTSWTRLGDDSLLGTAFSQIQVSPSDPEVLTAAVGRGIFGREPGRYPGDLLTGILRSTDGGQSWTRTLAGIGTDLEVVPGEVQKQWAALGDVYTKAENGVYRSNDGGQTWTVVTGPWSGQSVGRTELAFDPQNANTLYVSIQDGFDNQGSDGDLLGIWQTNNAQDPVPDWTALPTPRDANQWWYDHALAVDPLDSANVYLGGQQLWRLSGTRWLSITQDMHVDQHTIAFSGNRVIVGNDGGIYQSISRGSSWTNLNQSLNLTQYYEGSLHPTNPQKILAGSQDNGTHVWNGDTWNWIFGGDGTDNAISTLKPDTDWAVSYQYLAIHRTTDGGKTFTYVGSDIDPTNVPFIARFELCPSQPDLLIAGTDNLWRTANFFSAPNPAWTANSPEFGSPITALAFGTDCATYALGTEDGQVWRTTDGGVSWTDQDLDQQVPNRAISDLALDKDGVLWVTLSGFDRNTPAQPGHLFRRSLAGTWQNLSPPVDLPYNTVTLAASGAVYVGTDLGVWQSLDQGTNWAVFGTGLPNVAVFELQTAQDQLVAFTHGRGIFRTDISASIQVIPQTTTLSTALNSLTALELTLVNRINFSGSVDLVVTGFPPGVTATVGNTAGASTTLDLLIPNQTRTGIYPLRLTTPGVKSDPVTVDLVISDPLVLKDLEVAITAGGLVRVDRLRQQLTVSTGAYLGLTLPPGIDVTSPTVRSTGTTLPLIPLGTEPVLLEFANPTPETLTYTPTVFDPQLKLTDTPVTAGGFVTISRLRQQITIQNLGTTGIPGPFFLAVRGLTPGATVVNATASFNGTPLVGLDLATLDPGSSTTVVLEFENPTPAPLVYDLKLTAPELVP